MSHTCYTKIENLLLEEIAMSDSKELLKSLTDVNGIAGHEKNVKSLMKDYLTPVSDEIVEDNLGGIFGKNVPKMV